MSKMNKAESESPALSSTKCLYARFRIFVKVHAFSCQVLKITIFVESEEKTAPLVLPVKLRASISFQVLQKIT